MAEFLEKLRECRKYLTIQQCRTLRGQALSGDVEGAMKGLIKILGRLERTVSEYGERAEP